MIRLLLVLSLLSCRKHEDAKPTPAPTPVVEPVESEPVEDAAVPIDASTARLSADREAFWARYVGDGGLPGPETLAFCRSAKPFERLTIGTSVYLETQDFATCVLSGWPAKGTTAPLVRELQTVVDRWSPKDHKLVDARNGLTVSLERDADNVFVRWIASRPLDQLITADGIAGLAAKKLFGQPASALKTATSPPFYPVDSKCDDKECAAVAPGPPGGDLTQVGIAGSTILVQIDIGDEPLNALMQKLFGAPEEHGHERIYKKGGVAYAVQKNYNDDSHATITLSRANP